MKIWSVVAFWLCASDCSSGDSNGTVITTLQHEPDEQEMIKLLKAWCKREDLEYADDLGDPVYAVEMQESRLRK
jgi:hypothetical protein